MHTMFELLFYTHWHSLCTVVKPHFMWPVLLYKPLNASPEQTLWFFLAEIFEEFSKLI